MRAARRKQPVPRPPVLLPPLVMKPGFADLDPEPPPKPMPNVDTMYALATGRTTYCQIDLDEYERNGISGRPYKVSGDKANLLSSEMPDGSHMPVIDCDYPIVVMQSSTPGHGHLYIDKELTWPQYKALLDGMYAAGLIEKAWYENAVRDKRSYVRLPHIKKEKKA